MSDQETVAYNSIRDECNSGPRLGRKNRDTAKYPCGAPEDRHQKDE
jgi:hypothetical protein